MLHSPPANCSHAAPRLWTLLLAVFLFPAVASPSVLADCTAQLIALDPGGRRQSNEVLRSCRSQLRTVPLQPEIAFLRMAVYGSDSEVAETATSLLGLLADVRPDSEESLREFGEFIRIRMWHPSFTKRHNAAQFLEEIGWPWAERDIQPLFSLLAENPGIDKGLLLTKILARAVGAAPAGIGFLLGKWKASEVPLRYQILDIFRLADSSDPRVVAAFIAGLQDPHGSVQQVAIESLLRLGPQAEAALPAVISFTQDTGDEYLRQKAQQAIQSIRSRK